jgi:hypothetical protein
VVSFSFFSFSIFFWSRKFSFYSDFIVPFFYCYTGWGYFVAFTKTFTMYQIYHTWMAPPLFLLELSNLWLLCQHWILFSTLQVFLHKACFLVRKKKKSNLHIYLLDPLSLFFFSFIHMCIQCLGHFSTFPPIPLPPTTLAEAETILPLSLILLKRKYKQL